MRKNMLKMASESKIMMRKTLIAIRSSEYRKLSHNRLKIKAVNLKTKIYDVLREFVLSGSLLSASLRLCVKTSFPHRLQQIRCRLLVQVADIRNRKQPRRITIPQNNQRPIRMPILRRRIQRQQTFARNEEIAIRARGDHGRPRVRERGIQCRQRIILPPDSPRIGNFDVRAAHRRERRRIQHYSAGPRAGA